MPFNRRLSFSLLAALAGLTIAAHAADPVVPPPAQTGEEKGIWGAIAYSPDDGRHGFFWGADKRQEAEDIALKYCNNADGAGCRVVEVFRNHRHWDDDDGTGFPYEHCAALSVGKSRGQATPFWGAASATTRRDAEDKATAQCGGDKKECKIREWVCT